MPEIWLHCDCGCPVYKFVGDELPAQGTIIRSKDFEGAITGSKAKPCPDCRSYNYFKTKNIRELENA